MLSPRRCEHVCLSLVSLCPGRGLAPGLVVVRILTTVHSGFWCGQRRSGQVGSRRFRFCAYAVGALDEGVRHYRTTPGRVDLPFRPFLCDRCYRVVFKHFSHRPLVPIWHP